MRYLVNYLLPPDDERLEDEDEDELPEDEEPE